MQEIVRVIGNDLVYIDCRIKLDYREQYTDAFLKGQPGCVSGSA
jgi:hypothetical protein